MEQEETINKLQESIGKLKDKNFKLYFLTLDTKGGQRASVATQYKYVKYLVDNGYNASILHEKDDYFGVSSWLTEEYTSLPHTSLESGDLQVGPQDFLFIPEVFGHVIEQTSNLPCTRVIFCQSYDYIFETLPPGANWPALGISKVITTMESSKAYINEIFPGLPVDIIPPSIEDYFKTDEKPKKPVITIHTREPRDTMKIVKSFYIKFPQFKWITFRDMRGLPKVDFAKALGESCCSVWVDEITNFGTFPMEAMKCGNPVIGKVPNLKPDWLEEDNGFWTLDNIRIIDIVASFIKTWLEDNVPSELYEKMEKTVESYTEENEKGKLLLTIDNYVNEKLNDLEASLNKFKVTEEKI